MKLLLDENVSRRVLPKILELYPESTHLAYLDMLSDDDITIWDYAGQNGFTIVSKDKDFIQRSVLKGHPPKIIHLVVGNGPIDKIVEVLRAHEGSIKDFCRHTSKSYLVLGQ